MVTAVIALSVVMATIPAQALTVVEYPVTTPSAEPNEAALGSDGNVWFTEFNANQIGKITPSGAVTEYPIPTPGSLPTGITAGPDGALWFAESAANQIGRVTTSGLFTEYPVPTANSDPEDIASGPDGRLWFTEGLARQIGRVSTAGVFKEFPTNTSGGPRHIAAGPDGYLWYTEPNVNDIFKISTDGATQFVYTPPIGDVNDIAAGPDGHMWFADVGNNEVGWIDVTGTTSMEFPVLTAGSDLWELTAGPDGNLWFDEILGNNIGQITTSGVVTEAPIPTPQAAPGGITPGSDGNVWFTEAGGNAIGRTQPLNLGIHYVFYIPNRVFIPNISRLPARGDTVSWLMMSPGTHGIADSSGMHLFGFGPTGGPAPIGIGQVFAFTFEWAGTYPYNDPFHPAAKGSVTAPITVGRLPGTTDTAQVTWASGDAPAGFGFDVQVRGPTSGGFVDWRPGVTSLAGSFGPSDPLWAGPGTYAFRARLRDLSSGAASGFSKAGSVKLR
ncbi:MAG TPA: hypothetical protein VGH10_10590 [Actinomycetota bacterium]|jgi:streptogramin lyase